MAAKNKKMKHSEIPIQRKMVNAIKHIPIEYFKWGTYPDHFKIDMPHRHEFAELLFFTKGGGIHEIDFQDFAVRTFAVHYIPKSTVHFLKRDIQSDGFTISFDTEYLERNQVHRIINPLQLDPFVLDLTEQEFSTLFQQVEVLIQRIIQRKGYYQDKTFLVSLELLLNSIQLEKQSQSKTKVNPASESSMSRDFKYLVKTNIHQHRNVYWYASQLGVSEKHLGNEFKTQVGLSPKSYILQSLLSSVKKDLINSSKSIKQIAFEHEIDPSSLSKLFKKHVGFTMSQYRSYDNMEK